MLGFLIAFWSASSMSEGRLFFACVTTAYVIVALFVGEGFKGASQADAAGDLIARTFGLTPKDSARDADSFADEDDLLTVD